MFKDLDWIIIIVENINESKKFFDDLLDIKFDITSTRKKLQIKGAYSASKLELMEPYGDDSFFPVILRRMGSG